MPAQDKIAGKKTTAISDQLHAPKALDKRDPNYDSEDEGNFVLEVVYEPVNPPEGTAAAASVIAQPISQQEFVVEANKLLAEYLVAGDTGDAAARLNRLGCREYHDDFVSRALRIAMDRSEQEQKAISTLLALLFDSHLLSPAQVLRGFDKLIQTIEDLKLDVPAAPRVLLQLLEWAVADRCLPASVLQRLPESFVRACDAATLKTFPFAQEQAERLTKFKAQVSEAIQEYLNGGGDKDVRAALAAHPPSLRHEFVRRLVAASFERSDRHRELTSQLLSSVFGKGELLNSEDVTVGFIRLVGTTEDLTLDCPRAHEFLVNFIVRAVVDEILPPVFAKHCYRMHYGGLQHGMRVSARAADLLSRSNLSLSNRYRKVWTGTDPTSEEALRFKDEVKALIHEYFDSLDLAEATRLLRRIDPSPAQAAEFVRKLLQFAMEKTGRECKAAVELLRHTLSREVQAVSETDIEAGFNQAFDMLSEIKLDVPDAVEMMESFVTEAKEAGVLPESYRRP